MRTVYGRLLKTSASTKMTSRQKEILQLCHFLKNFMRTRKKSRRTRSSSRIAGQSTSPPPHSEERGAESPSPSPPPSSKHKTKPIRKDKSLKMSSSKRIDSSSSPLSKSVSTDSHLLETNRIKTVSCGTETDPVTFAQPKPTCVSRCVETDSAHSSKMAMDTPQPSSSGRIGIPSIDLISEEPQEIEGLGENQMEPYPTFIYAARTGRASQDGSQKVNSGKMVLKLLLWRVRNYI